LYLQTLLFELLNKWKIKCAEACGTILVDENAFIILAGMSERKRPFARTKQAWECNIRQDLARNSL
jgi:hypothetical protein